MPNGGDWKETFKFFIKELKEVYLPYLKQLSELVLPVPPLQGRPEEVGEVPVSVPAPPPTGPYVPPFPYEPEMYSVAGEPPEAGGPVPTLMPSSTPRPLEIYEAMPDYPFRTETPTPEELKPGPPTPWYKGPIPWWRDIPLDWWRRDRHIVQAPPVNIERKT